MEDKEMHYKTMLSLFPKMKYCPRINYIKKVKEDDTEEDVKIKIIAENFEISTREALFLVSSLN
jgi:chromosome segregation and condensation protein ScpB